MTAALQSRIAGITGGLLVIALALHLADFGVWRDAALIVGSLIAGAPTAVKAYRAARAKAFSIDLLVTIAVAGALIISEYVEAAVVSFLFIFGAWLEARTLQKTRRSLRDLIDLAPQEAQVIRDGETVVIPAAEVREGDLVQVQSGGKIAVDGMITSGRALINEATITGESVPVSKSVKDRVYSGTIVENGFISVTADKVGDDTTFAQIIELVEEAQDAKTRAQRFLDRFAAIYTPTIIVLSVLVLAITRDVEFALTFLVIACPGALVISTPVSMVAGLGNGARHGVLMKGGDALERLSRIDTLVFDKTGTLTQGRPEVTDIQTVPGSDIATADELLALAAALELASEHPLGRTIVDEAENRGLQLSDQPAEVEVVAGAGIRGNIAGRQVAVGSKRMLRSLGIDVPDAVADGAVERERLGNTVVYAVVDGLLAGTISIADELRPEAAEAIAMLRRRGVKRFVMLTGDNRHTADLVAAQLGIDRVEAELLPQDKVRIVSELSAEGHRVGMIGDGINDAPAIATADVGIAMGAGTDVSIQTADVILMANRFDQLVHAHSLANATVRNVKQNTFIAVGTVVLLLAGVLMQQVFMSTGMLVHEVSVLVVILNAVRLVRYRDRRSTQTRVPGSSPDSSRTEPSASTMAGTGPEPTRSRVN